MASVFDIVANSADGVFGVTEDQRITFWNRSAERILGLSADEVLGRQCHEVLGGHNESLCIRCQQGCATIQLAQRGQPVPVRDLRVPSRNGREQWLSVSTLVVPSRWQHLSLLIHLFRDVSRTKEIESSVMALLARLERLDTSESKQAGEAHVGVKLTEREQQVLRLLASGTPTREIARALSIRPATVRNHVGRILAKLGVHTRLEAVTLSLSNGLLDTSR
jgi:PAS domain S-box-containing protein